jgi:hypothetical protein
VLISIASDQLESARLQNSNSNKKNTRTKQTNKQKTGKLNWFRLFTFKHEFLKISVDSQTALAAETHLTEG